MQLTRAADCAVRIMIYLASLPPGTRAGRTLLADAAEGSEHFISKVLQDLVRARLIQSHRGAIRGFELAEPAEQITLRRIVEAIEGPIRLNVCIGASGCCNRKAWCAAHQALAAAQHALVKALDGATIGRLARESETRKHWLAERAAARQAASVAANLGGRQVG